MFEAETFPPSLDNPFLCSRTPLVGSQAKEKAAAALLRTKFGSQLSDHASATAAAAEEISRKTCIGV